MVQTRPTHLVIPIMAILTLAVVIGCEQADRRDQRLVELAERSAQEQSKQNEYIARQSEAIVQESQKLTEASKELVQNDSQARAELIAAQERLTGQLDQQRAAIDVGRDQLELERKQIAEQRHRDPILAASIQAVGLLAAALLPLLVCVYIIRQIGQSEPDDAAVAELLVHELVTDQPRLLPVPRIRPTLEHHAGQDLRDDSAPDPQVDTADLPF